MIPVEQREAIRRAYFVDEKSVREIAREFHCSRKTITKALVSAEPAPYTLRVPRAAPVLDPFKQRIVELLAESSTMPRKQRYTAHKIFEILSGEGYVGSEVTVRRFVAGHREAARRPEVFLPLEFKPGIDAQVDWTDATVVFGGSWKVAIARSSAASSSSS